MANEPTIEQIKSNAALISGYKKDEDSTPQRSGYYFGYIAGATAWAQWKVKHDELQAQAQRMADALEKCVQFKNGCYAGIYLNVLFNECEMALQPYKDGTKEGKEPVKPQAPLPELGVCQECGTRKATTDYNGHQYYVCEPCDNRLNKEFDEEYK